MLGCTFTEKQASVSRWSPGATPGGPTVLMTGPSRALDLGGHVSNVAWGVATSSHPQPELFKDGLGSWFLHSRGGPSLTSRLRRGRGRSPREKPL